jgi:para-nitrobenzyl esterase
MPINPSPKKIPAKCSHRHEHLTFPILLAAVMAMPFMAQERVKTVNGVLEGAYEKSSAIYSFKGIPFAAPPVGDLRWQPPQPVKHWDGVRPAQKFGPRAMQLPLFGDMNFRSDGMSEDCLYLNVWTPARSGKQKLPVLVYFYGGGFVAGDGSEPRYDGESMAKRGIVAVTVNYRLGIFGFFAHPELTRESPHHASGNYGLLDQHAALEWVKRNIAAFGGDPQRVTIAGESAGSISVSAQMASPLSKSLFAAAIGESGSIIGALSAVPLADAEVKDVKLASALGIGASPSLAALRKMPAEELLQTAAKAGGMWFSPTVDGYFLPVDPAQVFAAGRQMHVPLLAGVNSEESGSSAVLGRSSPTVENYRAALERLYPGKADDVFKLYPAASETEVKGAAQALASDRFISHSTWTWMDLATKTGGCPTYYYLYDHPRPPMRPEMGNVVPGLAGGVITNSQPKTQQQPQSRGAVHSAEIEYALGNLASNKVFAWTPDDFKISNVLQDYFANFIKTANPNGPGLPKWPEFTTGERLVIDASPRPEKVNQLRVRYELLDQLAEKK